MNRPVFLVAAKPQDLTAVLTGTPVVPRTGELLNVRIPFTTRKTRRFSLPETEFRIKLGAEKDPA